MHNEFAQNKLIKLKRKLPLKVNIGVCNWECNLSNGFVFTYKKFGECRTSINHLYFENSESQVKKNRQYDVILMIWFGHFDICKRFIISFLFIFALIMRKYIFKLLKDPNFIKIRVLSSFYFPKLICM